jgi:hypothetical protein
MRSIYRWVVAISATMVVGGYSSANAGFVGMPSALGPMMKGISSNFTLPPVAFQVSPALCRPVQTPANPIYGWLEGFGVGYYGAPGRLGSTSVLKEAAN